MKTLCKHKKAKTVKPYTVKAFGYELTVPEGSIVSNRTACGYDDNYRFWENWGPVAREVAGFRDSLLAHDLRHYGLNVPAEYCEPYAA